MKPKNLLLITKMKKYIYSLFIILIASTLQLNAQIKPVVTKAKYFDKTPALREMTLVVPGVRDRSWKDNVIENKLELPSPGSEYNDTMPDPVWQESFGKQKHNEPIYNFDGTPNVNDVLPPDTDGDVGPNHYFQIINLSFQIFDKQGNSLYGPADNSTLWSGFIGPWTGHNDGDPIVAYDELADRWVVSQFALRCDDDTWWELVAVSATSDPLGAYYRYAFEYPVFNDYPKMSVWPDAYYCSFNLLGDYPRVGASAYEREAMLIGDTNAMHVFFDLPEELATWAMLPADFDGTPPEAGTANYWTFLNDDDYVWWSEDLIRIWEFNVNWNNPEYSTFEEVNTLPVEPFSANLCGGDGLEPCIPQPEGAPLLDALSGFSMQPLQYRNFEGYETMVFNHTVNADGNGLAGIRWYELRKEDDVDGWYIYQQGTYAPDENYRWMGSIAMDARGYIALGYTVSSTSVYPSLRYTGRPPDAPLGEMTFTEEEIITGTGTQNSTYHRWGDYSMMAVDPANDSTFWYTGEYMQTTSNMSWRTRIVAFNLNIDLIPPAAITDLQAQNTTTNSIALNWIATGNDGTDGRAYYYDIRYNNEPINEDNWTNSIIVDNELSPSESGTDETFTIKGLEYSTDYYFAIKAVDKQNNESAVSNSPSASVLGPPMIILEEATVEVKIFESGIVKRPISISNTGKTDINYELQKDIVYIPENEGVVLSKLENGAFYNRGMTWADGYLYILERLTNSLYKYDTAIQMSVDTFNIHNDPKGICWDGTYLWIGDNLGVVQAYQQDGVPAGISFNCPFTDAPALTYSGTEFIVSEARANPKIYFVDKDGKIKSMYKTDINYPLIQFTWANDHYNNKLWFIDAMGTIGQINFSSDSAYVSNSFEGATKNGAAIAHDGVDLWQGENFGSIYRLDDGIDEISWFKATPTEGIIATEASAEIILQVDLTTLPEKDTSTLLQINSNDPVNYLINMPIDLTYSTIDLGTDTSFCSNLNILLDVGNGFKEYLWSDGSNQQSLLVDSAAYGLGTISLWAEAMDYCGSSLRDTIQITFEDCTGIEEQKNDCKWKVIPNPFSNSVRFEFELTNTESVEITLYNLMGEQIDVIHQSKLSKGKHNISWNAHDLANGFYMVQFQAGNMTTTQKLLKH